MTKVLLMLLALGLMSGAPSQATALPIQLDSVSRDYGSAPGKVDPGGNDVLTPDSVSVSDQSTGRFFDSLAFDFQGGVVDRFEITLNYSGVGPRYFFVPLEAWSVRNLGSISSGPDRADDDLFVGLTDAASPLTYVISAATDTGDIDVFSTWVGNEGGSLAFSDGGALANTFDLRSVQIDVYGTITPIPLPAGIPLLLSALGCFAFWRRSQRRRQTA